MLRPLADYLEPLALSPEVGQRIRDDVRREQEPYLRTLPMTVMFAGWVVIVIAIYPWLGPRHPVMSMAFSLAMLAGYGVTSWWRRTRLRAITIDALRAQGVEVCRGCGFDLRGLPDSAYRCPECGSVRERMATPQT